MKLNVNILKKYKLSSKAFGHVKAVWLMKLTTAVMADLPICICTRQN